MTDPACRATARLRLRPVTLQDLPAVTALETDPRTTRHRPGGPPSPADVAAQLRAYVAGWQDCGLGYWLVDHDGQPVGLAGVRPLTLRGRSCWNLYYRFSPDVWGRGLAAEAAREAVAAAGERLPLLPVAARTRPANQAAIRVALAAGLQRRPDLDGDGFAVLCHGW